MNQLFGLQHRGDRCLGVTYTITQMPVPTANWNVWVIIKASNVNINFLISFSFYFLTTALFILMIYTSVTLSIVRRHDDGHYFHDIRHVYLAVIIHIG